MRKERGVDAEENKRQAGGGEKDGGTAANIELEQGGSKDLNGTMFLVASAVTGEIVHLLRVFFNFSFYLSSCSFKRKKFREVEKLTWHSKCVSMKSRHTIKDGF